MSWLSRIAHFLFAARTNVRYDWQTSRIIRRLLRSDSNSVDVGAHRGKILKHLVRQAPGGTHFAFEPLPTAFSNLEKSFRHLPSVRLFDFALAECAGTAELQFSVRYPAIADRVHQN